MRYSALPMFVVSLLAVMAGPSATPQSQTVAGTSQSQAQLPTDDEIRQILIDRVDVQHKSVGMVVGIVTRQGRHVVSYGHLNQGDTRTLDGDTVFEIGSVTKIFTALLLSDMVQRGEVQLSDPLSKYLPVSPRPDGNQKTITLADLATQTSGLPFLPSDIPLNDLSKAIDVVAGYTPEQTYRSVSSWQPTRLIGSKWEYSNLGYGLLGAALASRAGTDYQSLVRARITQPLGMTSTAIAVSPAMKLRLAAGHDATSSAAPPVNMPAFLGAGCLRSSANDLLTFLEAFLGYKRSALSPANASDVADPSSWAGFSAGLGLVGTLYGK